METDDKLEKYGVMCPQIELLCIWQQSMDMQR
jgi:hypothetical protein